MLSKFNIAVEDKPDSIPIMRLSGRLDAEGARSLRDTAMELLENGRVNLIVNLADLEFVASSGLGTLLLLTEEYNDLNGQIAFVAPTPDVRQVISLLNIDQFLNLVPSEEEALLLIGS
jgi:anti-anti-sigma factor